MEELRGRIEVVPDPELLIEKIGKKRMHNMKPAGVFLIAAGILWLLTNLKVLPRVLLGPGLTIMAGCMCLAKMNMHYHKKES